MYSKNLVNWSPLTHVSSAQMFSRNHRQNPVETYDLGQEYTFALKVQPNMEYF